MIKILSVEQTRAADAYTIKNEPISSIDLMERAAMACTKFISKHYKNKKICIYAGCGNNGGDGLAIGRQLKEEGFEVEINVIEFSKNYSPDFKENLNRLKSAGLKPREYEAPNLPAAPNQDCLVVDAIFGSGLSRKLEGWLSDVVTEINSWETKVVSIDIPSGMFADSEQDNAATVKADLTLTFQASKFNFLMPDSGSKSGEIITLDIGLHQDFIDSVDTHMFLVEPEDISALLPPRPKFSHKGSFGHAMLMAGSLGKVGAAVLASKSCLRSGVGLLTNYVPADAISILQTAVPEAMCLVAEHREHLSGFPKTTAYSAIGIGPGIGLHEDTVRCFKQLIQEYKNPLVIDADAINILATHLTWMDFIPARSILTPHPGEFDRLAGKKMSAHERVQKQMELSTRFGIYILLKGAHSSLSTPEGKVFFNVTGNPGMSTAGSGDVLTGIITGLLAQGLGSLSAALAGMYIHGLAGDLAAEKLSMRSLISGDIIDHLPDAYKWLMQY